MALQTLIDKLYSIQDIASRIREAIQNKGVSVSENASLKDYPDYIERIQTGSGGEISPDAEQAKSVMAADLLVNVLHPDLYYAALDEFKEIDINLYPAFSDPYWNKCGEYDYQGIREYAFYRSNELRSVKISCMDEYGEARNDTNQYTIQRIGKYAFAECPYLEKIDLSDIFIEGTIEEGAFSGLATNHDYREGTSDIQPTNRVTIDISRGNINTIKQYSFGQVYDEMTGTSPTQYPPQNVDIFFPPEVHQIEDNAFSNIKNLRIFLNGVFPQFVSHDTFRDIGYDSKVLCKLEEADMMYDEFQNYQSVWRDQFHDLYAYVMPYTYMIGDQLPKETDGGCLLSWQGEGVERDPDTDTFTVTDNTVMLICSIIK